MNNKNIIRIEGSEFWGRYIYLTAAQGFALVKLMFDNRFSKGVCEIGEVNTHPCKQRQGYATMLMQEAEPFADVVEQARRYIMTECGGFEKFSMWGLIRAKTDLTD